MELPGRCYTLAVVLLGAVACGSSSTPVSPTPPSNPLSEGATWTVFLEVESCTSTSPDPYVCPQAPGRLVEMSLKTAPLANTLSAVLTSRTSLIADVPVLLSGQLQPDGGARYSGSYVSSDSTRSLHAIEVQELSVTPDERAGLRGTLTIEQRTSYETRGIRARVSSASRQPFADTPRAFQGAFEGFGTLLTCAGVCPDREAGERMTISLRLTHSGNQVSGEFGTVPVSGTANGSSLTLAGERRYVLDAYGIGTTLSRLESFSASIDGLGRLAGTLELYDEGIYDSLLGAWVRKTPFTERLTVELTTVIRQ